VYLGVDSEKFIPVKDKMKAKEAIGIERNCFVIGYCGRLGREKDLKTLYRGFLRAKRDIPNLRLMIVGSGVQEYEDLFKGKKGMYFMGSQNNVIPYLQAMDAFVLTSKTETTSLATLEAMSVGVPVLVTPVGHIVEYISDKKNGLLFPVGDAYALSRLIKLVYEDMNLRDKLSGNARKTILEMYSWDKTVKDIKEVFDNL
jgi:glycosyltransferase involved in cell wall biosynthesis